MIPLDAAAVGVDDDDEERPNQTPFYDSVDSNHDEIFSLRTYHPVEDCDSNNNAHFSTHTRSFTTIDTFPLPKQQKNEERAAEPSLPTVRV